MAGYAKGPSGSWYKSTKTIKGILMDIYGVLYDEGSDGIPVAIPGSVEAVKKLKDAGATYRFCSNTSTKTTAELAATLRAVGFDVDASQIFSPAPAVKQMLIKENLRPYLLVKKDVLPEFSHIDTNNPNCVVLGDAQDEYTYDNLNKAFSILITMHKPRLIAMGTGKYYKEGTALKLDVGAFTKALEFACGCQADIIGKPCKPFFTAALKDMDLTAAQALMIGDDIVVDVAGAQSCGMRAVQVRTGKYKPKDEPHSDVQPDGYVDNLLQCIDLYLGNR